MKTTLLILALLSSAAFAQLPSQPQTRIIRSPSVPSAVAESNEAFAENYLVTLSVTDNGQAISDLVVATSRPKFNATAIEPSMVLDGLLAPQENGTVLLTYALNVEVAVPVPGQPGTNAQGEPVKNTSVQYKNLAAQSQVRLVPGESLNVLKSGNRVYRLMVAKLPEPAAKAH